MSDACDQTGTAGLTGYGACMVWERAVGDNVSEGNWKRTVRKDRVR